jgi:hypothetical protein
MVELTRKNKLKELLEFVQNKLPDSKYEANVLVWAKTTKYGNWPAKIIEKHVENKKFYTVRFFDNDKQNLNENKIITKVNDIFEYNKTKDKDKCTTHEDICETAIEYGNKDIQIRKIIEDIEDKTKTRKKLTKNKEQTQNKIYNTVSEKLYAYVSEKINDTVSEKLYIDVSDLMENIKQFYEKSNVDIKPNDIDEDIQSIISDYVLIYFRNYIEENEQIQIPEIVPEILQDYKQVIDELILNQENFYKYKDILKTGLKLILKILVPDYYKKDTEDKLREQFNEAIKSYQKQDMNSIIYNLTRDVLAQKSSLYGVNENVQSLTPSPLPRTLPDVVIDISNSSSQKSSNNSGIKQSERSKRARESPHSSRSNNKKNKNISPTTQESSDSVILISSNNNSIQQSKRSKRARESPHSSRSNNKKNKNISPTTQESSDNDIEIVSKPDISTEIANLKKKFRKKIEEMTNQMTEINNTEKNLEAKNKELKELKENINQINKEIEGNNNKQDIRLSLKKLELKDQKKKLEELKENINQINKEIEELKRKIVVTNGGKPKSTKPEQKPKSKSTKPEQKPKSKSIKVKK